MTPGSRRSCRSPCRLGRAGPVRNRRSSPRSRWPSATRRRAAGCHHPRRPRSGSSDHLRGPARSAQRRPRPGRAGGFAGDGERMGARSPLETPAGAEQPRRRGPGRGWRRLEPACRPGGRRERRRQRQREERESPPPPRPFGPAPRSVPRSPQHHPGPAVAERVAVVRGGDPVSGRVVARVARVAVAGSRSRSGCCSCTRTRRC